MGFFFINFEMSSFHRTSRYAVPMAIGIFNISGFNHASQLLLPVEYPQDGFAHRDHAKSVP
jgi:hypothetical protein